MKKLFVILSISCAIAACGGGSNDNPAKEDRKDEAKEVAKEPDAKKNPDYQKGLELVAKSDCFTCHKIKEAATGPAYEAVAAKYAPATDEVVEKLANKVISGGSGNWGTVPMLAHPQLSKDDAKTMVKYVMALKK
jgi:cytochrome c